MGQAALAFVQRFDMTRVLAGFEKELRELAGEIPPVPVAENRVIATFGADGVLTGKRV